MTESPQEAMADKIRKMRAVKGGRPSHITTAERVQLRKGSKRELRDALRSRIVRDENPGLGAKMGVVRRLKHRGKRGGRR